MRIQEIMTETVQTALPGMAAEDAWELMTRLRVHHLVVKQNSKVVGVISAGDLGSVRGEAVRKGRTVAELMSSNVASIEDTETVRHAANLMRGRGFDCLPVMRNGKLAGIVTTTDLLELLGRGVDRPSPSGRRSLHHRGPHNVSTS
jgi:acetoin utilization protein AcuB